MLLRAMGELIWSLSPIVLTFFAVWSKLKTRGRWSNALSIFLGMAIGIAWAVVISLDAGPRVTAAAIPILPLMATLGAATGLFCVLADRQESRKGRYIYQLLIIVPLVWTGFYWGRSYVAAKDAFRLVVIQYSGLSGPTQWDKGTNDLYLTTADRGRVESLLGSTAGTLTPLLSMTIGESPRAVAVLVMYHDVAQRAQLQMPDAGTIIFVQGRDGLWQQDDGSAHSGSRSLVLSADPGTNFTRFEVAGPLGTQSTEIGVSHR